MGPRRPDMAEERWYPSVTPLNNGEMLVTDGVEGRVDAPEVRKTDGSFRALSTAARDLPLYPWIDVAPNGRAFYSGPSTTMRSLDTSGTGAWTGLGPRDDDCPQLWLARALRHRQDPRRGRWSFDAERNDDQPERVDAPGDADRSDGERAASAQPHRPG